MYKFRSHHLPGAEKPELNEGCMKMRRELATVLLGMDLKNVVFRLGLCALSIRKAELLAHSRRVFPYRRKKRFDQTSIPESGVRRSHQVRREAWPIPLVLTRNRRRKGGSKALN